MKYEIRYSTPEDVGQIYSLMQDVFKNSPLFLRDSIKDFNEYQGIIVIDNEKIVGALLFTVVDKFCYIEYIGTTKQYCGIGTMMLNQFLTDIDEKNLTGYLHVEKTEETDHLIKWYSKYGFITKDSYFDENIYPYFGEQVNAIIMTRFLNDKKIY